MSYCSICGTVEWHDVIDGVERATYCPKCNPRPVTILPLDEGNDFDINESEVWLAHGPQPVNCASGGTAAPAPPYSFASDPNAGIYVANGANDGAIQFDVRTGPASLEMNGSKVMTTYDELPETAGEGEIAFKKGENTAYVFDGEEWQNLGRVARKIRPGKDDKCDRRAAIAATKAKNA